MEAGRSGGAIGLRVGWDGVALTLGLLSQGNPSEERLRAFTSRVECVGGVVLGQQFDPLVWSVRVSLPASSSRVVAARLGSEGILLVTADSQLRDQLRAEPGLGHPLVSVVSGRDAMDRVAADPMGWDAVLFDLAMEQISAADLLEWLADCCPWMVGRTILMADPTVLLTVRELLLLRRCVIIDKPVTVADLHLALERLGPLPSRRPSTIG